MLHAERMLNLERGKRKRFVSGSLQRADPGKAAAQFMLRLTSALHHSHSNQSVDGLILVLYYKSTLFVVGSGREPFK